MLDYRATPMPRADFVFLLQHNGKGHAKDVVQTEESETMDGGKDFHMMARVLTLPAEQVLRHSGVRESVNAQTQS
jgi:hypothetical protein